MMPGRNSRRAYQDGREIEPMSLGNMRAQGVRSVWAECESCRHEAAVNVDRFADAVYVPDVARPTLLQVPIEADHGVAELEGA